MINKEIIKEHKSRIIINAIGVLLGLAGGYLYYHFYACNQGCPLNASPYLSMIWGGLLGYFVADMIKLKSSRKNTEQN